MFWTILGCRLHPSCGGRIEASLTDPVSLQEVFALLPEVRQARGRRHPLLAILNLTAVALLAGMKSLQAIAPLARDHGPELAQALGFTHGPTPCKATLSNVFRRLNIAAYENALSAWLKRRCPDRGDTLAIDGKTLRGSASYQVPGVHVLSAYAPRVTAVIAQVRVDAKTNEHKAAFASKAAATRHFAVRPQEAFPLVTGEYLEN